MKRLIAAALAVGALSLAGCGSTAGNTALLDAGKALDATIVAFDTAVDGAEAAHKSGLLSGADWTKAKAIIAQANGYIGDAQKVYAAGGDVSADLNDVAALQGQLSSLTAPAAATTTKPVATP